MEGLDYWSLDTTADPVALLKQIHTDASLSALCNALRLPSTLTTRGQVHQMVALWCPTMLDNAFLKKLKEKAKRMAFLPRTDTTGIHFNRNRPSWAITYWHGGVRKYRHFFVPALDAKVIQLVLLVTIHVRKLLWLGIDGQVRMEDSPMPYPPGGCYGVELNSDGELGARLLTYVRRKFLYDTDGDKSRKARSDVSAHKRVGTERVTRSSQALAEARRDEAKEAPIRKVRPKRERRTSGGGTDTTEWSPGRPSDGYGESVLGCATELPTQGAPDKYREGPFLSRDGIERAVDARDAVGRAEPLTREGVERATGSTWDESPERVSDSPAVLHKSTQSARQEGVVGALLGHDDMALWNYMLRATSDRPDVQRELVREVSLWSQLDPNGMRGPLTRQLQSVLNKDGVAGGQGLPEGAPGMPSAPGQIMSATPNQMMPTGLPTMAPTGVQAMAPPGTQTHMSNSGQATPQGSAQMLGMAHVTQSLPAMHGMAPMSMPHAMAQGLATGPPVPYLDVNPYVPGGPQGGIGQYQPGYEPYQNWQPAMGVGLQPQWTPRARPEWRRPRRARSDEWPREGELTRAQVRALMARQMEIGRRVMERQNARAQPWPETSVPETSAGSARASDWTDRPDDNILPPSTIAAQPTWAQGAQPQTPFVPDNSHPEKWSGNNWNPWNPAWNNEKTEVVTPSTEAATSTDARTLGHVSASKDNKS